jgi:hypothetical protein
MSFFEDTSDYPLEQAKATITKQSALLAQMAAALEAIKLASVTGATADTSAMRAFDRVCRAVKELPGASMARDIYESHIDSIWEEADRALTAYTTMSPDPQWQRVPQMLPPLKRLAALPIGAEIADERDLVLYKNAGKAITVGDVLDARAALEGVQ